MTFTILLEASFFRVTNGRGGGGQFFLTLTDLFVCKNIIFVAPYPGLPTWLPHESVYTYGDCIREY